MDTRNDYFRNIQAHAFQDCQIHSCPELLECIRSVGFLPLLESAVPGFCAESIMAEECRFTQFPDGTWEWPLWQWKGSVIREGGCVYGRFFNGKAGFISREWWPDFYNYRRSKHPMPAESSIEETILLTLQEHGSLITRELRAACGFDGPKMRSKFDGYVTRLQMGCYIVTEDFVYPTDRHGREYGWGWSLLNTPEALYGRDACLTPHTPEESYRLLVEHFRKLLPDATDKQIQKLIG